MSTIEGLLFIVGVIVLQVFLSKRESKWPGLVLPIIAFFFSLLCLLNIVVPPGGVTAGFIVQMFMLWLLYNIPTAVLLAIYFGCRAKQCRKKQLDKMNIQDLD